MSCGLDWREKENEEDRGMRKGWWWAARWGARKGCGCGNGGVAAAGADERTGDDLVEACDVEAGDVHALA